MRDTRNQLTIKTSALQRYLTWHFGAPLSKHIYVSEFPKSGGSWLCQMLGFVTESPYIQHNFMPIMGRAIFHSHYTSLPSRNSPLVVMTRDGRDVMISAYFHFLRPNIKDESEVSPLVRYWRAQMPSPDVGNVIENIPRFIELFFKNFTIAGKRLNWASYHSKMLAYPQDKIIWCRYGEMLSNPLATMHRLCKQILPEQIDDTHILKAIETFSFERQSLRKNGEMDGDSFLRKGISGDWKNYFTKEASAVFDFYGGEMLIMLDYEKDQSWLIQK